MRSLLAVSHCFTAESFINSSTLTYLETRALCWWIWKFILHLLFLTFVFDDKGQYQMSLFSIHTNISTLTIRLPHISCITRITICCLTNFAVLMIILPLFVYLTLQYHYFYIQCHFYLFNKLCESKRYSKSSSIFLWKVTIYPIQSFLELNKFLAVTIHIMGGIPLNIQRLN